MIYSDILRRALKRKYKVFKISDRDFTIAKKTARKLPKPTSAIFEVHLNVTEVDGNVTVSYAKWKSDRIFASFRDEKVEIGAGTGTDRTISLADPDSFKQIYDTVVAIFDTMECTSGK